MLRRGVMRYDKMAVEHKVLEAPTKDLLDELQSIVPIVAGHRVIRRTEPDGTHRTDVKVDYVDAPTDKEKKAVEDILRKRGLI